MDKRVDLHPEYIKYLVRKEGVSLTELAKKYDIPQSSVSGALKRPVFYGEQVIAEFLNIHPMFIWPSRYDKYGNPLHPHASANRLKPFSPDGQDDKIRRAV